MKVSRFQLALGRIVEKMPQVMHRLGKIESAWIRDKLTSIPIDRPIFVTGLARSGTTMLLELLSHVPDVATHRYKDFPLVHIPYWWNSFLHRAGARNEQPQERAHKDGMYITSDSPEAMEEILWMSFFPDGHDSAVSNVWAADLQAPAFEAFYKDHIRKILLLRGGCRYVSKGNYNVTRLSYIRSLFPEARFIIPIRDPYSHVASLMIQHERFCREESSDPKILKYMQRAGHYEFGLDRRPIHCGQQQELARVQALWAEKQEVQGWAAYWAMIHSFLIENVGHDALLSQQCFFVPYDQLCSDPGRLLHSLLTFCELEVPSELFERFVSRVRNPTTRLTFSEDDLKIIEQESQPIFSQVQELCAQNSGAVIEQP